MKKIFLLPIFLAFPFSLYADDSTTTPSVTVNINVRYKSNLVFSGPVTINQNAIINIADSSGVTHPVASDSALEALSITDTLSESFKISDLNYYDSLDSFYLNCLDITTPQDHACGNWQYVVNSEYPPMGADKYTLSANDTVYFYFGTARRVSLSTPTIELGVPVTVRTETYDYTNDTWTPIGNMLVGATQPDPNNPYSPLVLFKATSDTNGLAQLMIDIPGVYNVGLDSDYYNPTETLTVTAPKIVENIDNEKPVSVSGGSSRNRVSALQIELIEILEQKPNVSETTKASEDGPMIMGMSAEDFVKKYNRAIADSKIVVVPEIQNNETVSTGDVKSKDLSIDESQTASVVKAVDAGNAITFVKRLFSTVLSFFGLKNNK